MIKTSILAISISLVSFSMAQTTQPLAAKNSKKLSIHNHTRIDDYYWMNERDSKPVLDHLKLENDFI